MKALSKIIVLPGLSMLSDSNFPWPQEPKLPKISPQRATEIMKYSPSVPEGEIWRYLDNHPLLNYSTTAKNDLFFNTRLSSFYETNLCAGPENVSNFIDIIVNIGLLARQADRRFCSTMSCSSRDEPEDPQDDNILDEALEGMVEVKSIQDTLGEAESNKSNVSNVQESFYSAAPCNVHVNEATVAPDHVYSEPSAPSTVENIQEGENPDEKENHLYVTATVYHGDCSLMRLTSRFYFQDTENHYSFVKFPHYDEYQEAEDYKALVNGELLPCNRLLNMAGPSGTGKSFHLQYILRHIRTRENLRAFYLAHPEMFLETSIQYLALLLELVYSLAEDISKDQSFREYFISQAAAMLAPDCPSEFAIFRAALKESLKRLKEIGKTLVIVIDQENSYEGIVADKVATLRKKTRLAEFLRRGERNGAYILSSLSYTSEAPKSETPSRKFIRLLSDNAILAILKSRCSPFDRFLLSHKSPCLHERIQSTLDLVINTVGRCPVDIHKMMNVKNPQPRSFLIGTRISSRCEKFRPDADDIITRHEAYYNSLDSVKQQAFLIMLSIAGKCPPIGSFGYYSSKSVHLHIPLSSQSNDGVFSSSNDWDDGLHEYLSRGLMLLPQDSDDPPAAEDMPTAVETEGGPKESSESSGGPSSADDSGEPLPDGSLEVQVAGDVVGLISSLQPTISNEDYFTINIFSCIPGFEIFAAADKAEHALDRRYFFIDESGFVRPFSDPAFCIIRALHQRAQFNEFRDLFEAIRRSAPGIVFEASFFLAFQSPSKLPSAPVLLSLKNAQSGHRTVFSDLTIPLQLQVTSLDMKAIFNAETNVIWQCTPHFPVADFIIVCPFSEHPEPLHMEFNLLPYMPWVKKQLSERIPGRMQATLILGQLTVNGEGHDKGDIELCKKIGRYKKDGKAAVRMLIISFLQQCKSRHLNPCILFIWIAEKIGDLGKYHPKSIISSGYSIDSADDPDEVEISCRFRTLKEIPVPENYDSAAKRHRP